MTIQVALNHNTRYDYDRKVQLSPQLIRLRPAPHARSHIQSYSLKVSPQPHFLNWLQDPQGNWLARVVFPEKVDHFHVEVELLAGMEVFNPFDFFVEDYAGHYPFEYHPGLADELEPFLEPLPPGPLLKKYLKTLPAEKTPSMDFLIALNQRLQCDVEYLIRMEPGVQTPEQTLELGRGSCRDSTWLLVQILRHLGLAARFVSGYLIQLKADEKSLDGPSGTEEDFTDLHAWAEVYLPGAGWIGLDATSGLVAGEGHIPLVATPEPSSAAPISGGLGPCEVEFSHQMSVSRIAETPRVTRPYIEEQWDAIDALGEAVEAQLQAGDVRLTMGGEPTFISIDDRESAQWHTEALGEDKAALSQNLIKRLQKAWAPEGLLTWEQGKWYPGEPLPRWAYCLYWRSDGKPLIDHPARFVLAQDAQAATLEQAELFIRQLAERLGLPAEHVIAGREDPWHILQTERRLPENLEPGDPRLDKDEDRARLARQFEQGLDHPVGYCLPVSRQGEGKKRHWVSERWRFRQHRMYLTPGDSPMGLRLPLHALPWLAEEDRPQVIERDPLEAREPLDDVTNEEQPDHYEAGEGVVSRTAICIEPRDGLLTVFMPPLEQLEDYLTLVSALEQVAEAQDVPLRIEGYPPPRDERLTVLKITPDPGVIEVNIQPCADWQAVKSVTNTLYEQARLNRLGTEKFLLDGKHVGTGGGNHMVVGSTQPADSPFLRRPDLLGSLIRYWQNHPALSYLFSGLFIGPTSQAPRVDEARDDALYELEIALGELPDKGDTTSPWVVDRILRHLLTDLTGNTHRAEFCIDKLYSPDSATGRLGLVEFRNFEMPPHARMSLVQQLLLRALIARFWETPYTAPLVHWGTRLHDEFMLPHFVWQDMQQVVSDMRASGYDFESDWFLPHFEFRFARFGALNCAGITLELRSALEPWIVLGEESAGGGTARYVDSSVERLQLHVSGLSDDRYVICCNGRRLPLRATGVAGEYVAGVRFRAWRPWSCLHPTIDVHAPLVFDIWDEWSQRSVGGCTYHVAHPAGRNYETPPVNANAAESRRLERFQTLGHTPRMTRPLQESAHPMFPLTLDLRYSNKSA